MLFTNPPSLTIFPISFIKNIWFYFYNSSRLRCFFIVIWSNFIKCFFCKRIVKCRHLFKYFEIWSNLWNILLIIKYLFSWFEFISRFLYIWVFTICTITHLTVIYLICYLIDQIKTLKRLNV